MPLNIELDGVEYKVFAEKIGEHVWIHYAGKTIVVEPEKKKFNKQSAGQEKSDIEAPMPGKITKLLKSQGDAVVVGEAVLVMEAMKMEYTLKAGMNGSIKEVSCSIGEQVSLGKCLMKIKGS